MFDNTKPNVIILNDHTDMFTLAKVFGPYKIACELRDAGYEVAVIGHLHTFSYREIQEMLRHLISDQTLWVGFATFYHNNIQQWIRDDDGDIIPDARIDFAATIFQKPQPRELGSMLPHGKFLNRDLRQFIRSLNARCRLVLGGVDAQDYDYARDYDYVVMGYSDTSAVNLTHHLHRGDVLEKSRRSLFGPTIIDDRAASSYPFTERRMTYADHDCILPGELLTMEVARGCIFRCGFCSYPLNGKKKLDYIKQEEILYNEFVDNYERFGATTYFFSDDTFNDSVQKVEMMARVAKRLPFELKYRAYIRADLMGAFPETIDLLYQSGLRSAFCGIETLHERASKIIGKGSPRQRMINTLRTIKDRYGDTINMHGSFILGLPEEPVESMRTTIDMLLNKELAVDSWTAIPFTLWNNQMATYQSEFDLHPEKYGYEIIGTYPETNWFKWRNKHTSSDEMLELRRELDHRQRMTPDTKMTGNAAFYISGLGLPLEFALNQDPTKIDYRRVIRQKIQRIKDYRASLARELGMEFLISAP